MRSVVLWAALAAGCGVALAAELPSVDEVLSTGISNRTDGALVIGIEEYPFLPAGGKQVPFAVRKRDEVRRRLTALMIAPDPEPAAWTQAAESAPEPVH